MKTNNTAFEILVMVFGERRTQATSEKRKKLPSPRKHPCHQQGTWLTGRYTHANAPGKERASVSTQQDTKHQGTCVQQNRGLK